MKIWLWTAAQFTADIYTIIIWCMYTRILHYWEQKFNKLISIKWKDLNYLCIYNSVSITRTENCRRKRKIQSWISTSHFSCCAFCQLDPFHCPEKDRGRLKSLLRTFYVYIFLENFLHLHAKKGAQLISTHSTLSFTASFHWAVPCFNLICSIHVILWGHKYWFPHGFSLWHF